MQPTSLQAYDEVKKTLGRRQSFVFIGIDTAGSVTNSELATQLDWPINTITPRVFELRKMGLVKEDCKRKCTVTGRRAIAWRVRRLDEIKEKQMELELRT
jgi:Mn-dependent DtxR family transcriptional regulator